MSDYSTAVADLMRQRRDSGQDDVPVNLLILGRALDAALPGMLEARNGNFYVGSARMDSVRSLYGTVQIPGVSFKQLTMVGDVTGTIPTDSPPAVFLSPFLVGDIAEYVGAVNVDFLAALAGLWNTRIRATGLQDDRAVASAVALLSIGIIVLPDTAERLGDAVPRLPSAFLNVPNVTAERRAGWYTIAERMRTDFAAYNRKQLDVAAQAVAAAARDVAFWDGVYTVVQTVRDAPAIAAGAIVSAAGSVFLRPSVLILGGLVAAGAALWFYWPRIASTFLKRAPHE